MLPYTRIILKLLFCYGQEEIGNFLNKYFICPPDRELFVLFYKDILSILTEKEQFYLKQKQFHLRKKYGPTAKSILKKIGDFFEIEIIPKPVPLLTSNLKRFLDNRELRIFTEILILGRVEIEKIEDAINDRFRLNFYITKEEIEDFSFWFFDPLLVDDIGWQRILERLSFYKEIYEDDPVFRAEFKDKLFAMRHSSSEVLIKVGALSSVDFPGLMGTAVKKTFESLQTDWSEGASWSDIEKKIKTFSLIGEKYAKHHRPDNSGSIFESLNIEVKTEPLHSLPFFDKEAGDNIESDHEIEDD